MWQLALGKLIYTHFVVLFDLQNVGTCGCRFIEQFFGRHHAALSFQHNDNLKLYSRRKWKALPMLWSLKALPRRSCQRWFTTITRLVQRTSGLSVITGMHSLGYCKVSLQLHHNNAVHIITFFCVFVMTFKFKCVCSFFHGRSYSMNRFRPRILIDVSSIGTTTTIYGCKISMPIMVAPTAMQKMAHPEGMYI